MRRSTRIWTWVVVLLAAIALVFMPQVAAYADAGDPPAHSKSSTPNGDGTHKIELTVTGDSNDETISDSHVNVLIVYDESSSMNTNDATVSGRNYTRADVAEDAMYTLLNGLVGYDNQGVDIYTACIGFGTGTNVRSGWTDSPSNVRSLFDQGLGDGGSSVHDYNSHNGTAWGAALSLADDLLGGGSGPYDGLEDLNRSQYPTFVILVTDGGPTVSTGSVTVPSSNWTDFKRHFLYAAPEALSIQNRANTTLYGIYTFGTDANLLDDLMDYANTGSYRTLDGYTVETATSRAQHDFGLDEGADKYYNASNAEALETAISDIFNEIVEAMGIAEVSMSDGTTSQVKTSSGEVAAELLGVDEDSYQYWMSIPVDGNNQFTRTKNVGGSAEEITYTVTDNGDGTCTVDWTEGGSSKTVTVDGSVSGGQFKFEWTADSFPNDLYEYAPNDAELVDGAVEWDLSNVDVLLDGVTYSVTFDVYPSQTAMDYKARLENGEAYDDVVPEAARDYFHADGSLETNTEGTLTYSDTRLDNPGPRTTDFTNPPAIATVATPMHVEKEWEGDDAPDVDLQMEVIMDGNEEKPFEIVTLNSGNSWATDINISYGIMRDGKVMPDAPGHDFSFAELGSEQYKWELVAPTVHPMIVDGVETMLIKVDDNFPLGDHDPITIGTDTYYIDEAVTSLSATNHRRSNLNITKVVDGEGAPEDATFPFTIVVDNSKAENGDPDDTASDYYVWFSIKDADGNYVTDANVGGATAAVDSSFYYAESGATITIDMQAGWNVRFTNLPSGTTYTVSEGEPSDEDFSLVTAESTGAEDETFEINGSEASGTIVKYNAQAYEVTFTNEYVSNDIDITVTKVWDDADDRDGIRPESVDVVLLANGDETDYSVELNEGNGWSATFTGLSKTDDEGEEITYEIAELEVEGYEVTIEGDAEQGFTITNVHQAEPEPVLSDPPVQKIVQGNPPKDETFTFQMKAVTEGAPMPEGSVDGVKTVTITGSGSYEFGEMEFTEAGTWVYEITEVDDGVKNYTYDTTVYTLTIEVTEVADGNQVKLEKTETVTGGSSDTAVFTNVYKGPSPVPKTGDATPAFGMAVLAAAAAVALGASAALRRRED